MKQYNIKLRVRWCDFVDRLFLALVLLLFAGTLSSASAQQTTPPSQELQVPAIAPDYRAEQKSLPELGRVGVDMDKQRPLSLHEALARALENNKDIEVARHNVKLAEFALQGSRGAYDPRVNAGFFF